jgi:hypothetical protein
VPLFVTGDRAEDLATELEDHAVDEVRYACMSRPMTPKATVPVEDYPMTPRGTRAPWGPIDYKSLSARGPSNLTWDEYHELTGTELGKGKRHQIRRI